MARTKPTPTPPDDNGAAATQAAFDQWRSDTRQYQQDVARELAAAPDTAAYLAQLAEWNDAIEAAAAAAHRP